MKSRLTQSCAVCAVAAALCAPVYAADPARTNSPAVDNTGINERDRDGNLPTAQQQPNNETDVDVVANVRKALTEEDSLSTNAQNVKIIAQDRVVILRGPVANAAEKAKVESLARNARGVAQVRSELDVKH